MSQSDSDTHIPTCCVICPPNKTSGRAPISQPHRTRLAMHRECNCVCRWYPPATHQVLLFSLYDKALINFSLFLNSKRIVNSQWDLNFSCLFLRDHLGFLWPVWGQCIVTMDVPKQLAATDSRGLLTVQRDDAKACFS